MGNKWEQFVQTAIKLAHQSAEQGGDPFAALLVYDGAIVASSLDVSVATSDPTAHAELNLIRTFCSEHHVFSLEGYALISSTEPCVMCSGAIHWARIGTVVFSVSQARLQRASGGKPKPSSEDILNVGRRRVEVIGPILEEEGFTVFEKHPLVPKIEQHKRLWVDNGSDRR